MSKPQGLSAPLKLWLESAGICAVVGVVAEAVFARTSAATAVTTAIVVDSARVMRNPFRQSSMEMGESCRPFLMVEEAGAAVPLAAREGRPSICHSYWSACKTFRRAARRAGRTAAHTPATTATQAKYTSWVRGRGEERPWLDIALVGIAARKMPSGRPSAAPIKAGRMLLWRGIPPQRGGRAT